MAHKTNPIRQQGFVLVVTMILLLAVSLLVLGGMRSSVLGERMAGNAMDRNLAKLAAEQAVTQGLAVLQANSVMCLDTGCTATNTPGVGIGDALAVATAPDEWSDTNSVKATTKAADQKGSGKFLINLLSDASFTPTLSDKSACRAYSVRGRGEGENSLTVVVLQTIAYVCPAD
jgi:type IV pilus assembly protein PilX